MPQTNQNNGNNPPSHRPLHEIATEIAVPYIVAMYDLTSITDSYGADSAQDIVLRFLCNAVTWRGETARRIKRELRAILRWGV